jgi:hypothetical protein
MKIVLSLSPQSSQQKSPASAAASTFHFAVSHVLGVLVTLAVFIVSSYHCLSSPRLLRDKGYSFARPAVAVCTLPWVRVNVWITRVQFARKMSRA